MSYKIIFSQTIFHSIDIIWSRVAKIAQRIRQRPPFYGPGFESQAPQIVTMCFVRFKFDLGCENDEINKKRPGLAHIEKNICSRRKAPPFG